MTPPQSSGQGANSRLVAAAPPKSRVVQVVDRTVVADGNVQPPPRTPATAVVTEEPTRKRKRKTTTTFSALLKEVEQLGASALEGKEKRDAQVRHLQSIGALQPKGVKAPLKMLFGMRRAQEEREQAKREHMRELGLGTKKKPKQRDPAAHSDAGSSAMRLSSGRFKSGVLTVSKKEIKETSRVQPKKSIGKMMKKR